MYSVIGLELVDYVNKQNKRVQGVKIHCTYPNDNCNGLCVESFYMSSDKYPANIDLGMNIEPLYNKYGNVQSIHIIKERGN